MQVLAVDQGTTGTTSILYNQEGHIQAKAYREFTQIYPQPAWVEHDPLEIWQTVLDTIDELYTKNSTPLNIKAIGITNQRETTVIWNKKTGVPIHNAIVWQCRRTSSLCKNMASHAQNIYQKTGLPLDAYFSATKIKWLLENCEINNVHDLLFGTIDTWLIWKLSDGQTHATDYSNAARTMLFNINNKQWDNELCKFFNIPSSLLPEVKKSKDDYGKATAIEALKDVSILAVAGDQQAALFGQGCFEKGQIKNTYGTGCFMMMNTGQEAIFSNKTLITTLAINQEGDPCYALEGSVFIAGAAIQWLRDELRILKNAADSEKIALSLKSNEGVYLVPAFVGLAAPHWNADARGTLVGMTRGTGRSHIIRAALEAMAFQSYDVLEVMEEEAKVSINELHVDGGATANNFLLQFQADILNKKILRPQQLESTSLGVAYLAGIQAGVWKNTDELSQLKTIDRTFSATIEDETRTQLIKGWKKALRQTQTN